MIVLFPFQVMWKQWFLFPLFQTMIHYWPRKKAMIPSSFVSNDAVCSIGCWDGCWPTLWVLYTCYTYDMYVYIYIYTHVVYNTTTNNNNNIIITHNLCGRQPLLFLYSAPWEPRSWGTQSNNENTPSPPTKTFDFGGFDSSKLLILRGGNSHVKQ